MSGRTFDEPAVERLAAQPGAGVRVGGRPGLPGLVEMCFGRAAQPRRGRRILRPRMLRTGVVRHLVLDHLDAGGMRLLDQVAQGSEVAEVFLDRIETGGAVAVVVGDRLAVYGLYVVRHVGVVVPGVEPERRDPEVAQVRQARGDARQVSAVVTPRLVTVRQSGRALRVVVRRIAVREPVGHGEVDEVVVRETGEAAGAAQRRQDLEGHRRPCRLPCATANRRRPVSHRGRW